MAKRDRYVKETVEELECLNANKELRYPYLEHPKAASNKAIMQSYYKRLAEDAQKSGLKRGLSQELEQGLPQGLEQGLSQDIKAPIEDNLEEGKDKKVILTRLEKHFSLTEKEAEAYFDTYNSMSQETKPAKRPVHCFSILLYHGIGQLFFCIRQPSPEKTLF